MPIIDEVAEWQAVLKPVPEPSKKKWTPKRYANILQSGYLIDVLCVDQRRQRQFDVPRFQSRGTAENTMCGEFICNH